MKKIKSIVTVGRKSSLCLFEDGSQSWVSNTVAKVGTEVKEADCITPSDMQKVADRRRTASFMAQLVDKDAKIASNAMAELIEAGYTMPDILQFKQLLAV